MTWQQKQDQPVGLRPACDRCGDAWWTALGEPAPVYPTRDDGVFWLAELYGWYTTGPRLLCPPCAAIWCAGIGHLWHHCPPMRMGGQLIDPELRYCTRCGDWQYLTGPAELDSDVALTPVERVALADLERQFDAPSPGRPGGEAR